MPTYILCPNHCDVCGGAAEVESHTRPEDLSSTLPHNFEEQQSPLRSRCRCQSLLQLLGLVEVALVGVKWVVGFFAVYWKEWVTLQDTNY